MGDLVTTLAAGFRSKAAVGPTTFGGPLRELSGVGFGVSEPFAGAWQRNISGAEGRDSLLSFAPVYACVTRIAGDIAKLGISLMQADDDGIAALAPSTSPYWDVVRKPNHYQNRIQFIDYWLLCKLLWGNAYALKVRDGRGIVRRLYLMDPRRVTPVVATDGGVYYSIGGDQLSLVPNGMAYAPAAEVIHDRGPTLFHPLCGVPPVFAAALSGSLGLRIQRNSLAFFSNMSRPSGMITAPGTIDDVTSERLRREWNENFARDLIGRLAVLGDGLKYEAMTIAAEQSQLAEQLGLSAVDVATAFGMPAYKINQGAMPTNNNVQALNQQYYSDCLQVHIEAIELCLDEGVEVPPGYGYEFDVKGLLRMDSLTQIEVLTKGVQGALIKPDEGRRELGLGKVKGGDAVFLQQQNYSLEALAKRDASDDPFGRAAAKPPAAAPAPAPEPSQAPPPAGKGTAADFARELVDVLRAAATPPEPPAEPEIDAEAFRKAIEAAFETADA